MSSPTDTLKTRFYDALSTYKRHFRNKRHKMRNSDKKREIEFAYLVRVVQNYGFDWVPELFVEPEIERMERIVTKLSS